MLQLWSNDRYRSTRHRVTVPAVPAGSVAERRLSLAYFLQPAYDAVISPLARNGGFVDGRAEPVTAGAHVWAKYRQAQGA